ncbi:hypothetical protein C8R45DRAFT_517063 [Mycena sanguinolenta]|nr:hypothetical protein C8R45DRAFT_517063 [Mycena sanguinolenta]
MLQTMLQEIGDLIKNPPSRQRVGGSISLGDTHRWCFCPNCSTLLLASEPNLKHSCPNTNNNTVFIRPSNFPSLKRIVYPHDILSNPVLASYVPNFTDVLVELTIKSIFAHKPNRKIANGIFLAATLATHPLDFDSFEGSIWVAKGSADRKANATLHVAMALDRCAASLSLCPANLLPVTAKDDAKAWVNDGLKPV